MSLLSAKMPGSMNLRPMWRRSTGRRNSKLQRGLKLLNQAALDSDIISTRENDGMPVHITKDAQASHTAAVHMLKKGSSIHLIKKIRMTAFHGLNGN